MTLASVRDLEREEKWWRDSESPKTDITVAADNFVKSNTHSDSVESNRK